MLNQPWILGKSHLIVVYSSFYTLLYHTNMNKTITCLKAFNRQREIKR